MLETYDLYTLAAAERFKIAPEEVTEAQREEAKRAFYKWAYTDKAQGRGLYEEFRKSLIGKRVTIRVRQD